MKEFDFSLLPEEDPVVLTSRHIDGSGPFYIADFRDNQILIFVTTGHYIGYGRNRGIILCKGPLQMMNGIWTAKVDEDAAKKFSDMKLEIGMMDYLSI